MREEVDGKGPPHPLDVLLPPLLLYLSALTPPLLLCSMHLLTRGPPHPLLRPGGASSNRRRCCCYISAPSLLECNSIMSSSAHLGGCFVYVRKQLHCLHLEHFFRLQMISIGYWMSYVMAWCWCLCEDEPS